MFPILDTNLWNQDELGTDAVGEVCIPVQELLREPKNSQFQISGEN